MCHSANGTVAILSHATTSKLNDAAVVFILVDEWDFSPHGCDIRKISSKLSKDASCLTMMEYATSIANVSRIRFCFLSNTSPGKPTSCKFLASKVCIVGNIGTKTVDPEIIHRYALRLSDSQDSVTNKNIGSKLTLVQEIIPSLCGKTVGQSNRSESSLGKTRSSTFHRH
jgi:hypothetical protein